MEVSRPKWLDEEFLGLCLNGESSDLLGAKVISFQVERAVPVGNNYGSELYRVKVKYCKDKDSEKIENTITLIIKGPVENTVMEFMGDMIGKTEYQFYYKYLPFVRDLIQVQFAPKSYFSPLEKVIVLEDLKELGFSMADRHNQLDYEHCKQYFKTSGKLHAVGISFTKKHPELIELFPNMQAQFLNNEEKARVMMTTVIIGLKCLIRSIEPLNLDEYKPYLSSIKKYIQMMSSEKFNDVMMKEMEQQSSHFKSMVHGDCWTTNMMFKYDKSGKPIDIRLVDFQLFSYDAVVADIINFTWMSANNDVLENNLDDLYNIYCDSLNSTLEELECQERYPFDRLKKEVAERRSNILFMISTFLPLTQAAEVINNSTLFSENLSEDEYMAYYQGEHYRKKFPKVLELAAKQGVFDWVNEKFLECGLSETNLNLTVF